jgi:hypothetical protein
MVLCINNNVDLGVLSKRKIRRYEVYHVSGALWAIPANVSNTEIIAIVSNQKKQSTYLIYPVLASANSFRAISVPLGLTKASCFNESTLNCEVCYEGATGLG